MARKFLTALDLAKNELQNAAVQSLGSAPSAPVKFQLYGNSGDNTLYWWDGAQWIAAKAAAGATPAATVTTQAVGDAAVVGASTNFAREDHKHGREAFAAVTAQTTFGAAAANGVATTLVRSDHVHGTPTHDDAAHSAIHLNALAQPTVSVNFGGQLATNLAAPVGNTDSATKLYVDSAIAGLNWHAACRFATTVNGTLATAFANGQSVDGTVVTTGDRILIKDQTTATENGIYVVTAGAPTRATDADTGPELLNAAVWVSEGTANHDTQWVCNNVGNITVGSTAVTFVQYNGASVATAGGGLTATGNVYAVGAGTGITVAADTVALDTAYTDGRYALVAAGAKRFSQATIGGATSQVVTHGLNTQAVVVSVFRTLTPWEEVDCDIEHTSVNTVTLRFAVAPATNEFTCAVIG